MTTWLKVVVGEPRTWKEGFNKYLVGKISRLY